MSQSTAHRSKYWWLWPDFYVAKDAYDAAKMGIIACGLISGITGLTFIYRYSLEGNIGQLLGGLIVFIIYSALGYGIFKMSRVASSTALVLFLVEKIYSFSVEGKQLGIAILLAWYLVQANRAVYWFRRQENKAG
jgi:hypothetical protein